MKKKLSILICTLLLSVNVAFAASQQVATLEKVSLQLKWLHQFQFAGYYAAKEQGYYAAEGLDVDIFERSPNQDVVQQVVSGERNFAVGDSGVLSYYARGEQIVALAAIFQHNPLVFVSKQSSGIISPYEMKGKRIMFDSVGAGDSSLRAMLTDAGLTEKDYTVIKQNFSDEDFIKNKIDVMSAYLSNEIFNFQQKNIKVNIINPQNYSVDFYGDMLFTSQQELLQHQERTEKFRRATLKGWQYALDHPEELVQLIHNKYHSKHSLEHLRFEAEVTRKLILPDIIPLGQIDAGRLRKVAEMYAQLNLSQPLSEKKLAQFIRHSSRSDDKPLIVGSEQNFPPFALGKTDATAGGFTVELWRAVAEEAHLNSKIRVLPWNQVLDEFKAEKIDVLINFAIHDDRRLFADFTVPHVTANEALFVRDDDESVHSEADLVNKQFIIVKGDFALEYLQEKSWDKQIIFVDTAEDGLQLLANGRHDAMLISKIVGKQTLEKLNISNVKMLPIDIGLSQRFGFAVHKGDAELLAKINEALAIIKANGTYDELYEKWFGIYEEKELLPLVIKYLTPIVIVFLLMLLVIFYRHSVERKQHTKQLAQKERHLRAMFEASPECVKLVARDGTLLSMNRTGLEIIEVDSENEVRNTSVYSIIAPEYRTAFQAFNEAICDGKSDSMEFEIIGLKGSRHWMATHSVPFKLENNDVVQLAFSQEITKRKQTEERLRILSVAVEQSPTSIAITDLEGNLIYVNPKFTEVTGYSFEEVIGQNPRILQSGITARETYKQLWGQLTLGKLWQGELTNKCKNGDVYTEEAYISPVKDLSGVTTHYVGVKIDITERKQMEAELQRSNAELEQFAYAVSHDMRQPLRMVTSYLGLIEKALQAQLDDDTGQFLTFAVDGAKRMDSMILALLDYSRVGKKSEAMTIISTRAAVDEALLFLKPTLESCDGQVEVFGDWIDLVANRDELTRLFQNLIGNALKYHQENQPPLVQILAIVSPNTFRVEVKDSGIGINPTQIDRLFKVFSRLQTRSRFEGTGVGLALCRKIVEHHGGKIGVESEGNGKGCTFWFEIPRLSLSLQAEAA